MASPPTLFIRSGLIFQKQSRPSRLSGQLLSEVQKPKYRRQGDGPFPASSSFLHIYTQSLSQAFLNLIFKIFLQQLLIPGSAMIFYVFCRKAGDAVGVKSGSLETVAEGKMLLMFHSILNNTPPTPPPITNCTITTFTSAASWFNLCITTCNLYFFLILHSLCF